ncbi:ATP-dependent protease La [Tothia fuscella]|uniref:Lon protease homolog, mitochondrial n=1 Tax=Tothia fuscella TaxID=1048955 RepID=A0A9P4NK66_9PEZI|nr:ATP-dependent protease La [Tothia fuscella]
MLYGQNLPWRIVVRGSSNASRSYSTSSSTTRISRCLYSTTKIPLSRRRIPNGLSNPSSAFASSTSRDFSTATSRWKEKVPHEVTEEAKEEEESEESREEKEADVFEDVENASDAKTKAPEPIPSGGAAEAKGSAAGLSGSSGGPAGSEGGGGSGRKKKASSTERALTKPVVPDVFPQVMAIPISKRPLFPGHYKVINIKDPDVIKALYEAIKRGQPYIGAFLLKNENADQDVIQSMDEVYDVGTFCQVTSAFPHGGENSIQAVIYPHRRIKMTSLVPPGGKDAESTVAEVEVVAENPSKIKEAVEEESPEKDDKQGDVVASFEEAAADVTKTDAKEDKAAKAEKTPKDKQVRHLEPTSFLKKYNVSLVNVENLVEEPFDKKDPTIRALVSEIVNVFKDLSRINQGFRDHVAAFSTSQTAGNVSEDPVKLADFAVVASPGDPQELQEPLESPNVEQRLHKGLILLKKEYLSAQLQNKINKDVESKIQKRQREYFLMEQMKGIRRELGLESDGKDKLIESFKEKANKLAMPDAVKRVFEEELSKLGHIEPAASEFNVTRNYLDWLTQIPWGQRSAENFGIQHAMKVLDDDHHGLKDVKDRILEFIAVGKLRGTVEGKILCMVGPPGVGKTSIGKSIARALNRQYYRFSVGGLTDVAEIKGHRRTYVGALPGRIIQALKKCQTENPLVLIDEVDKIGRGHHGDPSSALLELLDPEQNNSFLDHYLDVPVDLSKVLFVCTANMTDTIPRPLLDRMEMIELSGYVADEKMAIAERYLAPAAKDLSGLKDADVILEKNAIAELINKYCRESGVRNLKKQIEKVYRKAALKIIQDLPDDVVAEDRSLTDEGKAAMVESEKDLTDVKETSENIQNETTEKPRIALQVPDSVHVRITDENLKDYVGPPIFTSDRLYDTTPAGVAMGLAWTQMGGAALYVESILETALSHSTRPSFERTGNLKPVMKESTQIAYSFAKSVMARRFPGNKFFEHARVHLHCPEGAVQKDGPSAGITMATSMLSLALDEKLDPTIAMTGELTVTGKVLRIGGLREKTVAARRAGAKTVIFPRDNISDWLELPQNIKEGIEGKPVEWYSDVFDVVFPNIDTARANSLWKSELRKPTKAEREAEERDEEDRDEGYLSNA